MLVQAGLGKKWDLISKITRAKRTLGMAQVIECLLCTHKTLSLNLCKKEKQNNIEDGPKSSPSYQHFNFSPWPILDFSPSEV
jgi:hypothetical protein